MKKHDDIKPKAIHNQKQKFLNELNDNELEILDSVTGGIGIFRSEPEINQMCEEDCV